MRLNDLNLEDNSAKSDFREYSDSNANLKKSTKKRKADSTPKFKRKLCKFERKSEIEEETKMTKEKVNNKVNEDELSEIKRQKPMTIALTKLSRE